MFEQYIENQYLRALVVFLLAFLAIRLFMFALARISPIFTKKTKTDLDDVILERTSSPLTVLAFLAGLRLAIEEIVMQEGTALLVEELMLSSMIVVGAVLAYRVLDSLIVIGYRDFGRKVRGKVNESLLQFFHSMLVIILIVAAFLVILSTWGIEIGPLLAGLGVAGIAIAFALQSTLSNVFGGISMLFDRSINVGDMIHLDDGTKGYIMKINLRSTKIRTFDNELVIVPNGKLSESNIKNLALPEPATRVVVPFGVAYGADVEQVKKLVLAEIKKVAGLVEDREIVVRFVEMGESSLNFKVYFHVNTFDGMADALDDANTRIYNALNKAKISIPFPQMDVHLKK